MDEDHGPAMIPFSLSSTLLLNFATSRLPSQSIAQQQTTAANAEFFPKGASPRNCAVPMDHREGVQERLWEGVRISSQLTSSRPPLCFPRANFPVRPSSNWFEILWTNRHRRPPRVPMYVL